MQEPGWYPDPSGSPAQRWWNGISWGEQTRPAPPGTAPPLPPARPRRVGRIVAVVVLAALAGIGILVGTLIWAVLRLTGGPRGAVTAFYDDLQQQRVPEAAARLCDRYAADGVSLLSVAYSDQVYSFEVDSVRRDGDTATVDGTVVTGSASAYPVSVTVVREDGEWKVCSLPGAVPN